MPLPHLSSSSSSSPSSLRRSLFSCPASSALPATAAAAAALLFLRGSPSPALPQAAARVPRSPSSPSAHPGAGWGGWRRPWGMMAPGDRCTRCRPSARLLHPPLLLVLVKPAPAPTPNNLDPLPRRSSSSTSPEVPPSLHCSSSLTPMVRTTTRYARTATTAALTCNLHAEVDCCVVEEGDRAGQMNLARWLQFSYD
jgi:hypothetical protein